MNRTAFSLPDKSEYRTRGGLAVTRVVEQFTGGASRLDDLIDLLDRRRGVVLSSGTTVPGRYESFRRLRWKRQAPIFRSPRSTRAAKC